MTYALTDLEWLAGARCQGQDAEQFFVHGTGQARRALRLCGSCDVRTTCLQYALDNGMEHGIWGGLTERQRRAYARHVAV